jgi:phosphate:Na+ symporter
VLDDRFLQSPSLALQQANVVLRRMHDIALQNYRDSVSLMNNYDHRLIERIREEEAVLDRMEDKLEHYLVKLSSYRLSTKESQQISIVLRIIKDYERIGDYAINLVESAENLHENKVIFSALAVEEVTILYKAIDEIILAANAALDQKNIELAKKIEPLEETVDAIVELLKNRHVERLKQGTCNIHAGIVFLEILTNLERIADHCSNIGIHVLYLEGDERYDAHEYIRRSHEATDAQYVAQFDDFMAKYYEQVEKLTATSREISLTLQKRE